MTTCKSDYSDRRGSLRVVGGPCALVSRFVYWVLFWGSRVGRQRDKGLVSSTASEVYEHSTLNVGWCNVNAEGPDNKAILVLSSVHAPLWLAFVHVGVIM